MICWSASLLHLSKARSFSFSSFLISVACVLRIACRAVRVRCSSTVVCLCAFSVVCRVRVADLEQVLVKLRENLRSTRIHPKRDLCRLVSRSALAAFSVAARCIDCSLSWSYDRVRIFVESSSVRDISSWCLFNHEAISLNLAQETHNPLAQHRKEALYCSICFLLRRAFKRQAGFMRESMCYELGVDVLQT